MRLLIIALCAAGAYGLACPKQCNCSTTDELDYFCRVGSANVTIYARTNEYVTITCEGTNFTCSDLPVFNFANNITLPSLGMTGCSPTILRCLNQVLQASSVNSIMMTKSTEPLVEEDVAGLGDVQKLWIRSGPDKLMPSAINSLHKLEELRISSETYVTLQSNVFAQSPELKLLELSSAKITDLPEDTFKGLSHLVKLFVWDNNLRTIGVNSLRGLDSLQQLSLNTNGLKSLTAGTFSHVPKLKSLSMDGNEFAELPERVIYNLTDLENITIQQNKLELVLQPRSLCNLPSLKNLHLEYSMIKSLPQDLLTGNKALTSLWLTYNKITSLPLYFFKDLKSLETLDLSFNRIEELNSGIFAPLKHLKTLNLDRNNLVSLPDSLFSGLGHLNYVSINHNYLSMISSSAFLGAIELQTLSLVSNHLTLVPPGYLNVQGSSSPFNMLFKLRKLYLQRNYIDTIFDDWRYVLLKLEELDLSRNNFTMIVTEDCQFLSENVIVNLQHNKINEVILSPSVPFGFGSNSKSSILLDFNPLTCDCGLYNLAKRLGGTTPLTSEPKFVVGNAKCASPPHLKGDIFKNVSPYDLKCDLECNNSCSICERRPETDDLNYNCINIPKNIPDPEDYNLSYITLRLKNAPTDIEDLNLRLLNLSNNGLQEIPFSPSKTVKTIDFSNNKLTKIPFEFLKVNTTLYLSNNPFECTCWNADEITSLNNSSLVADLAKVTCENGGYLKDMNVHVLCSAWRAAAVASGIFIALLIIAALIVLTFYRFSHEILVYITSKGLFPCCFIEDPIDANKEYDIFVSYAHKDREYLQDLLPKLEKDFGQKTCVHYRDWPVGDLIPDQINKSVEKSRRTIILLSANFLESTFANMEFRTAHNFALKEGKTRIILILLEDVSKLDKLTDELKAYIKTNTYLSWDDPNFWQRLHRALPMRNNKKFVLPDMFKQAGTKSVKSGLDVQLNSEGKLVNVAIKDCV